MLILPTSHSSTIRAAVALIQSRAPGHSLTPDQRAARETSLADFVKLAWRLIEPETVLTWNWHLTAICDHVQALLEGRLGKRNLMVLVPPGFAKSTVVSVAAPAWRWITRPAWRSIFASGNPQVATRDSMKCRNILEHPLYRRTFGISWHLADDANLKTRYANTATGFRMALSTSARVTGDRADALFIDDQTDVDDAYSESARTSANRWYDEAFANRLNDLRTGTRCLIMQRLHPDDLAGHILEREASEWEVLTIPQQWEETRRTTTSLGWTDPRTTEGELAFPTRFPERVIELERLRLGESGYAGQHQQRPFAKGGEVFKESGLRLWPRNEDLPTMTATAISIDSAFKTGEENDYSVAVVLGQFAKGVFILDVVRGKYAYPQLKATMIELSAKWRPSVVLVEDKASGQSLIQDMRQNTTLPVRPVKVDGDKLSRAHTCVPTWEAGRVFAHEGAPFLADLLSELTAFPKSAHDDQVDALVQGLRYLTGGQPNAGLMEYYRQEYEKCTGAQPS